ncbi:alpha/beta fold hydrolase [Silvibacterium acidisoli]|uniref:alpha/beta fold hydrolase n=1 Tax=Acidobacteriaceae bacterium ZG23-2 TaxID=2883246 RepID=UPI00406D1408
MSDFYQSDDARLFYTTMGNGPDLVLLHPTPCDHRFWLSVAEILASRFRLILPDLRGHGRSEAGSGAITVQKLSADLIRLLDDLEVGRALFAGCSIGGYTLYEFWRQASSRVGGLAFCNSRPQADSDANRAKREEWIAKIRERGTAEFVDAMLGSLIGPTAQRREFGRIDLVRQMMQTVTPQAAIAILQGLAARPDSVETLRTIRVPCFVLAGGEDTSSTTADMKLLAEQIRNGGYGAEFTELRDAGHYAPWEQPGLVGRMLLRFFESVSG